MQNLSKKGLTTQIFDGANREAVRVLEREDYSIRYAMKSDLVWGLGTAPDGEFTGRDTLFRTDAALVICNAWESNRSIRPYCICPIDVHSLHADRLAALGKTGEEIKEELAKLSLVELLKASASLISFGVETDEEDCRIIRKGVREYNRLARRDGNVPLDVIPVDDAMIVISNVKVSRAYPMHDETGPAVCNIPVGLIDEIRTLGRAEIARKRRQRERKQQERPSRPVSAAV